MHKRTDAATRRKRLREQTDTSALRRFCVLALLSGSAAACTHAQAKVQPELPPLEVPAPPPRVVQATEMAPPPQIALP